MRTKLYSSLLAILFIACNTDEKTAEVVADGIEHGAIIRTIFIDNAEFDINDTNSIFSVEIEEQDAEFGELLEGVDVYVRFKDNTISNTSLTTEEFKIKTLILDDFTTGPSNLPRTNLRFSFSELMAATGLSHDQVACKDQFLLRLVVRLTDGRSFTEDNSVALILAFNTFFSSPYCYTINIVEPIEDNDLFTGTYNFTSIVDGPNGPTFTGPNPVEITRGHSNNTRKMDLFYIISTSHGPREYEFTVACDELIFGKNQLASIISTCDSGNHAGGSGNLTLLGPDIVNATVNPSDDSVFDLWLVEGYKGRDGGCGFGTVPSRLRFTKQ